MDFLEDERRSLLFLAAIYLALRLPVLLAMPLVQDESIYAIMAEEQAAHPTLVPTFLGYPVSWKPAPFFWLLSAASLLPLPLEASYRVFSLVAGLATLLCLQRIFSNCGMDKAISFLTLLIFTISFISINPDTSILLDSLNFLLASLSILSYTEKGLGRWRFIAAALFAFSAFFVKLVVAFMIPVLAAAYFWQKDRKILKDPLFLLSLLAVPLAMAIHAMALGQAGLLGEFLAGNIGGHTAGEAGLLGQAALVRSALMALILSGAFIWFAFSLTGFAKNWKSSPFMSAWYALTIFPLLSAAYLPWYYLPVMPAISYFAVLSLALDSGKRKTDRFFKAFFSILVIITLAMTLIAYSTFGEYFEHRELGALLSGKENVLIIGQYRPGIVAYKILPEMRSGKPLDFGWIVIPERMGNGEIPRFVKDYHDDSSPVVDGSFGSFFSVKEIFRKDTNITKFEYVAVGGPADITLDGYELVGNWSDASLYRLK